MADYKVGMFFKRKFKITEAQPPSDVKEAFSRFTNQGSLMSADQLLQFLIEVQKEPQAKIGDAEKIIEKVMQQRHHISKFTRNSLTLDDFHHYLCDEQINPPINPQVHHDMTAPLSHYYIYTGHNSYLTGNQLSSDCSDAPIVSALKRGVRVIELDIWPNSSEDDVDVLHGGTLTTPVELIKCLRSIKEHAFSASPYPVVITLEDHLTPDLRIKVAEMVTNTFGDMLYYPESECLEEFPSPEELKFRVMLSTKPPQEYLQGKKFKGKERDLPEEEAWGKEVDDEFEEDDKSDSEQDDQDEDDEDIDDCDRKSEQLGSPDYKRLIAIHAKKHKGDLNESLKVETGTVGRLSLSEPTLHKAATSHGSDIIRFTQKNFLRVYPKGIRVNSSNYNPLIGWMHGAQMVAFNMQGYGRSLWLMQGMFRSNGGCGYVKKPDILMKLYLDNKVFDPREELPIKKTLKVHVYMGDGWRSDFSQTHFDSYSPPDFYVRVGIAGVAADSTMKKTEPLEDNWVPVWEEGFVFPLTVPELALLRIEVHEYDMSAKDDFAGQTCLPVSELWHGIRAVPLFDRKGDKYKSVKLLMRFDFV